MMKCSYSIQNTQDIDVKINNKTIMNNSNYNVKLQCKINDHMPRNDVSQSLAFNLSLTTN